MPGILRWGRQGDIGRPIWIHSEKNDDNEPADAEVKLTNLLTTSMRNRSKGDECQRNLMIGCVVLTALMATIDDGGISSISQDKGPELLSLSV